MTSHDKDLADLVSASDQLTHGAPQSFTDFFDQLNREAYKNARSRMDQTDGADPSTIHRPS